MVTNERGSAADPSAASAPPAGGGASLARAETDDDPRRYDYSNPSRSCDIVMKGGITSGVVYPHAVSELARTYRFVNVGGTSAGAIAAAAVGAAELGRASGGFQKLAALPDWLTTGTNLFSLFQPQPQTKRLYSLVVASMDKAHKLRSLTVSALRSYWLLALLGALPGLLVVVLALVFGEGVAVLLAVVAAALVAIVGVILGVVVGIGRDAGRIPGNGFGLCSGLGGPTPPALTPWLADLVDDLAGRDPAGAPTTFGDLQTGGVRLELMTTNLTQRRPLRIPWVRSEGFFFEPAEMRRFFPERVVRHMEQHPPPAPAEQRESRDWQLLCELLQPLRPLPATDDLPIIVATRLSLSFPILLSALPLHAVDWSRTHNQEAIAGWRRWLADNPDAPLSSEGAPRQRPRAEPCWFSDGGISSNFPIHFFDAPLPSRPTFAINLRGFHPDHPQSPDETQNVYLPERSGGGLLEWWYRYPKENGLGRLRAFIESIVRTMQNRVDEAQMRIPGYRDRVVHVGTSAREGGMNLNMSPEVIAAMTTRGREAARRLQRRFAEPPEHVGDLSWDSHRWTRYRSTIAALTTLLHAVRAGYEAPPEIPTDRTYPELLARKADEHPRAYIFGSQAQRDLARDFTAAISAAAKIAEHAAPEDLAKGAPKPEPEVRIVPRA